MNARPAAPEPAPSAPEGSPTVQYYRRILHEMIDLGADLARLVHQQARQQLEAPAEPTPATPASNDNRAPSADLTVAFERTVRTVRRTILLAQSLDAPPRPLPGIPQDRIATRKRIIRAVEDAIHGNAGPADASALHAELLDRLDAPEFADDIEGRDIAEVIREIRRDLGLEQVPPGVTPCKRRTPEDLAILQARAAGPNRPAPPWPPPALPPFR